MADRDRTDARERQASNRVRDCNQIISEHPRHQRSEARRTALSVAALAGEVAEVSAGVYLAHIATKAD
ncbi:hypothetical protein OYE22_24225 [Streptomyces sp. 71268]|uniref:hypothetical protein n=1 Tax=Streptomyces sp. 71268 TaxID=3002640 RepID=UPI0023F80B9D|nr:hypothetical protein [Streptomyces sp. 71268]WEV27931.1 hypothetical protein OYE22_24225 [Streptomyces sp. 71268]